MIASKSSVFPEAGGLPEDVGNFTPCHQRIYLCGGELRAWRGAAQEVFSPAGVRRNGAFEPLPLGSYPLLSAAAAQECLAAAAQAFNSGAGEWPMMSVEERIACVQEFCALMARQREEVVLRLMLEIGKSREDAAAEFDRTVKYICDTVEALKDLDRISSRFVIESGIVAQIRRAPLGVVLCMGPFNYPLNETFTTLIPALIMGNTVVFKPAKFGVLLLEPLLEPFRRAFPAGVVNTVYGEGREVIAPIMRSGRVDCLAFIGSSRVADELKHLHPAPHRLRCVLGLGAKNPAIILADADLEVAIEECVLGALSFNGQRCTAIKIIFVHETVAQRFVSGLSAAVDRLPRGMPWEAGVKITPLPEPGKCAALEHYVNDALAHGAQVINPGGGRWEETFFHPAVLYPVGGPMRIYHEEQFGPVVAAAPFSSLKVPVDYVINSPYGQQAAVFGRDPKEIARLVDPLVNQVCRVNINSQCQRGPDVFPFTGRKDSAEGTLSVSDALRVFSIRTLVAAKGTPQNKEIVNQIVKGRLSKFISNDFIL